MMKSMRVTTIFKIVAPFVLAFAGAAQAQA